MLSPLWKQLKLLMYGSVPWIPLQCSRVCLPRLSKILYSEIVVSQTLVRCCRVGATVNCPFRVPLCSIPISPLQFFLLGVQEGAELENLQFDRGVIVLCGKIMFAPQAVRICSHNVESDSPREMPC